MRFGIFCLFMLAPCVFLGSAESEAATFEAFMESRQVVATIYFSYGSADLSADARSIIKKSMSKLNRLADTGKVVRVEGYSSPEGLTTNNMRLSMRRAESVAEYLDSIGCQADIHITGYGNMKATSSAPAEERRVEIAAYEEIFDLKSLNDLH